VQKSTKVILAARFRGENGSESLNIVGKRYDNHTEQKSEIAGPFAFLRRVE
jgi:hypothetical protein